MGTAGPLPMGPQRGPLPRYIGAPNAAVASATSSPNRSACAASCGGSSRHPESSTEIRSAPRNAAMPSASVTSVAGGLLQLRADRLEPLVQCVRLLGELGELRHA